MTDFYCGHLAEHRCPICRQCLSCRHSYVERGDGSRWCRCPNLKWRKVSDGRSDDVVRTRVQAIWQQHPDCTAKQVVASMGAEHPLGIRRAGVYLKMLRMAAAKRSPAQKLVRWHIDRWTATRILIGAILKRHPGFTGKQVIEKLGPDYSVRLQWVWQVMSEYHWASTRPSPNARRKGRRFYNLWRSPQLRRKSHSVDSQRRAS